MKSFLHGKKCLEVAALRPPTAVGAPRLPGVPQTGGGALTQPASAPSGAHVEVVKEGGKVVRLIVTCGCGERVEIDCLYSAGA